MAELSRKLKLLAAYSVNLSVVRHRKKGNSSEPLEQGLCRASMLGIEREDLGDVIFEANIQSNTGINSMAGLSNGGTFSQIESSIGSGYFSSLSATAKGVYSAFTTSALVASYAVGASSQELCNFFSGSFAGLNSYLGQGPTGAYLTTSQISSMLSTYNTTGSLSEIFSSSPKNSETAKIYFKYFDLSPSFADEIKIDHVRDSAILQYDVSGKLNYSPVSWLADLPECEEVEVPIFSYSDTRFPGNRVNVGPVTFPCIDSHSFKRPITGLEFIRNVVDGPYSSGNWNQDVCDAFIGREKSGLSLPQYSDNRKSIQTFDGSSLKQVGAAGSVTWVQTDIPFGEYVTPFAREKSDSPVNGQVTKFHIGNAYQGRTGSHISGYVRNLSINPGGYSNELLQIYRESGLETASTGIKFVPLRLSKNNWKTVLSGTQSNPAVGDGIYQLALNFDSDFFKDINHSQFADSGICGPPQMNELSDLPYLMFYQSFDNRIENSLASINIGFAQSATEKITFNGPGGVGHSFTQYMMATTGSGGYSPTFEDSSHHRASDFPQASVNFSLTIPSTALENTGLPGGIIKHNFFGMGNNLDGGKQVGVYLVSNGGIRFSGNLFSGVTGIEMETGVNGHLPNLVLISGYSGFQDTLISSNFCQDNEYGQIEFGSIYSHGCSLGSMQKDDLMLEGWGHPSYGFVKVSKMYAYAGSPSGTYPEEFVYSGFSSGNTFKASPQFPLVSSSDGFAANPYSTGLISSGWIPILKKQRRANFAPRYWRGPFASASKKFLYPNAADLKTGTSIYGTVTSSLLESINEGNEEFYDSQVNKILLEPHPASGFIKGVGFPHYVIFDMKIEEYSTKEFFKKVNWNQHKVASISSIPNVDAITPNFTWKKQNLNIKTNCVDSGYAGPDSLSFGAFEMGTTGKNPLIYNSPPNFVHGFINDTIGYLSGTSSFLSGDIPQNLMSDTGAYIVKWRDSSNGTPTGDYKYKNPECNFFRYKTYSRRVTGVYVPPGYRMQDGEFHPEYAIRAWPEQEPLGTSNVKEYGFYGADPLYYNRVGSLGNASGLPFKISEENQGDFHRHGLHGDSWLGFSYGNVTGDDGQEYSYGHHYEPKNIYTNYHRDPERDWEMLLPDIRSTGFGIHFSALHFFPSTGRHSYDDVYSKSGYYKSGIYTGFSNGAKFDLNNKVYSFVAQMKTGFSYPLPSGNGWQSFISGGDTLYPDVLTWQMEHTGSAYFYRHASKMDVTFTNLRWSGFGQPPSDVEYLYQPSGTCSIEGNFSYSRLREAPVFSEGIFVADSTTNDPIKQYGSYPQYLSDVLKDHGEDITIPINSSLLPAPSKQVELKDSLARTISDDNDFIEINTLERDFNKYRVIAISDYSYLNASVMPSYEASPPADDLVFPLCTMLYSANKGQEFPDNSQNPSVSKTYEIQKQYQYYDGELTDSSVDHRFRTSIFPIWGYSEPDNGKFIPSNVTIREAEYGFY